MIPTATGATTNGSSTPIRHSVAPRSAVSSRPARPSAMSDLGDRGEQEDAQRVDGRLQEVRVVEDVAVVLQADELALAADQAPVVDGDDRRVDQREHPDDQEQDEERRDVRVRREPHVPATEALPKRGASRRRAPNASPRGTGERAPGTPPERRPRSSPRHREARCSPIPRGVEGRAVRAGRRRRGTSPRTRRASCCRRPPGPGRPGTPGGCRSTSDPCRAAR